MQGVAARVVQSGRAQTRLTTSARAPAMRRMSTLPPPPPPATKPKSGGQKQAQFTAAVILTVGLGYYMVRKRNIQGSLNDPPEKSALTRHMVSMRDRIDQDKLRALLAEEEEKEARAKSSQA